MGFFSIFLKPKPDPELIKPAVEESENAKRITHKIVGTTQYVENILKLATKNPAYSYSKKEIIKKNLCCKNLYEYSFSSRKTELVPEPTNPYDSNAIMVLIDGVLVGYIKAGSCTRILNLIKKDKIAKIESHIIGGRYQILWADDGEIQELEKGRINYGVRVTITEKT